MECIKLVRLSDQLMNQRDNCSFELSSSVGSDGNRGEGSPQDVLADVGRDEKGNTRTESVSLLHHIIEHDNDNTGEGELEDNEDGITGSNSCNITVHTGIHVTKSLTDTDNECEYYTRGLKGAQKGLLYVFELR